MLLLGKKENEMFVVDRIEGLTCILENISTKEKTEVPIIENVSDGDVILFDGEKYLKDEQETQKRKDNIRSKFDRLRSEE